MYVCVYIYKSFIRKQNKKNNLTFLFNYFMITNNHRDLLIINNLGKKWNKNFNNE